jgi:hypothetical protein
MATIPAISNVASTISAGNFASKLAVDTGGLSSIKTSLDGIKTTSLSTITDPSSLAGDLTKKTLDGINPSGLLEKAKAVSIAPPEGLAGVADAAKGISGSAFSAIAGSMKPLAAGVPQNLTAIAKKNAEVQAAADTAGSATGETLDAAKSAASGTLDAAKSVAGGAASSLASGISKLPGGQSSIAAIVNKETGTSAVTDTLKNVTSITKTASSAALNKISTATASLSSASSLVTTGVLTGPGSDLAGKLSNPSSLLAGAPTIPPSVDALTKGLQAGKQPLSALASTGLPAGAAAALNASMNSLSTSSPFPLKMPTVAESTVDRGELNASVGTLLGDKKIPTPNFGGGISAAATGALQAVNDRRSKLEQFEEERKVVFDKQKVITDAAKAAYEKADRTLPEGDPEIDKLGTIAIAEIKKSIAILDETSAGRQAILNG